MKKILKKLIPEKIFSIYHFLTAFTATCFYGFPSEKMIIVGITGTKGKTTTANFLWSVLQAGGFKTGLITTANIKIGDEEILNPYHMTMPGRFTVQKSLRKMLNQGCKVAIVETTSQGLVQFRHIGINYDVAIFTNLTPEHIDSHKTFENYKQAKGILFKTLSKSKSKVIDGKKILKTIIANSDSEHSAFYLSFNADKKITFGLGGGANFEGKLVEESKSGVLFKVGEEEFLIKILGGFNILNALPSIVLAKELSIETSKIKEGLESLSMIPGRMEEISNQKGITLIVDYAHEKQSMTLALETANKLKEEGGKTIVLLGAEGGGRDKGKRPVMGEIAGRLADFVIVSNVDPYEDDPLPIAEDIAVASEKAGKERGKNLFVILDRREGIRKALELAKKGDVVMITGKGAEQSMVVGGESVPWDDRDVVREELLKIN
ncbi:MAG: hypothetical protein QG585_75 [Patescibacteria group bacterium]|jgi:UDP-N-acetylmuramoyl-L-alanyl-D-glutamate--2,6-diaminopimelate ligase|nr:hypothetical protein [Patescibacteria group bacterium]